MEVFVEVFSLLQLNVNFSKHQVDSKEFNKNSSSFLNKLIRFNQGVTWTTSDLKR